MEEQMSPVRVVLVTGSSGFLGQHVVKELQEEEHAAIEEIRLFDNRPYVNKIGPQVSKPKAMKEHVGDICDATTLAQALSGVDAVIHCASIVDSRFFADSEAMERVNVRGTSNVVECCVTQGVPYLVYVSSVAATRLVRRNRLSLPFPDYVGAYGETKARAEGIVARSNGRLLSHGKGRLRTLSIRMPPLYGELDQVFITKCLQIYKLTFDFAFTLDHGVQCMYAGNAASLLVQGIKTLAAPASDDVSGKLLYAADETTHDISLVLGPITESCGVRMFPFSVPSWLVLIISCLFWGLALLLSPLLQVNSEVVPSPMEIVFIRHCPTYDENEAAKKLRWKPKYSVQQAVTTSIDYYRKVKL
ncbi:LOW QUALITY PROTEIN: 3 beta-hydroxysteroid dehydrogenase type 7-like [Dermacentor silvarum]|uniref:LOW QUALITY PROTEIN: 3 beta-hydroxysteroid dehydrogenase type 7-like n=1 Tax=Dermacentor silvarum TaxID=543639 RepID=UPI002101A3CC|nr:LOW QUALITY PROTEIN: 3 beta-hydroxysteroid dehydrogenase type 7-like [Dermacentor silvarum]